MANSESPEVLLGACLHCGKPIVQPLHRGRKRQYCQRPGCRKAESRLRKQALVLEQEQEQRDALEKTWLQFDQETREHLSAIAEGSGLTAARRATEALLHVTASRKQQQELTGKRDVSSSPRVPPARVLAGASIADLMRETARRLNALSSETSKERGEFVDRYGLALGSLYAALVPYLAESAGAREKSLDWARKYNPWQQRG